MIRSLAFTILAVASNLQNHGFITDYSMNLFLGSVFTPLKEPVAVIISGYIIFPSVFI
jgi:hypothetical protein